MIASGSHSISRVPAYGTEALTLLYRGDHAPLRRGGLWAHIEYEPRRHARGSLAVTIVVANTNASTSTAGNGMTASGPDWDDLPASPFAEEMVTGLNRWDTLLR
jgi:hypothetical protein